MMIARPGYQPEFHSASRDPSSDGSRHSEDKGREMGRGGAEEGVVAGGWKCPPASAVVALLDF